MEILSISLYLNNFTRFLYFDVIFFFLISLEKQQLFFTTAIYYNDRIYIQWIYYNNIDIIMKFHMKY